MSEEKYIAYCFKCKKKEEVNNPVVGKMKNGMNSVKGTCLACNGKVYKILPKNK